MITVTEKAARQLQALIQEHPENASKGLRIYVETGGCAGMQYGMTLDHSKEDDEVIEREGVQFLLDPSSAGYLRGSTIDYSDELTGAGFRINNPNVNRSCGCGSSFEPAKN